MANIISTEINIIQALVDLPALNNSTIIAFQTSGGVEGELGTTDPTIVGTTTTPMLVNCDGQQVTCIIRLRTDDVDPVYFTTLSAGDLTFTVTYDDPLIPPAVVVVDLGTLQGQGDVSDSEFGVLTLPLHIRSGGRTRITQPIAFKSGMVSVGDYRTVAVTELATAVGSNAWVGGASSTPDPDLSHRSAVLGSGARAVDQSAQAVVIGPDAIATLGSDRCVVIGYQATSYNLSPESVVVGVQATADTGSEGAISIGYRARCTTDAQLSIAVGSSARVSNGSRRSIAMGPNALVTESSTDTVCLGQEANATTSSSSVVIGTRASAAANTPRAVVVGYECSSVAGHVVVVGHRATVTNTGATQNVLMGTTATIAVASQYSVVIGVRVNVATGTASSRIVVMGFQSDCTNGDSSDSVLLGYEAKASGANPSSVVLSGKSCTTTSSARAILIGYESSLSSAPSSIVIGFQSVSASSDSIVISTTPSTIDNLSSQAIAIGNSLVVTASPGGVAFGQNLTLLNSPRSTCVGQNSSITGLSFSLTMGYGNSIADTLTSGASNANAHLIVGTNNTLGDNTDGSAIFGVNNTVTGTLSMALGHSNLIANNGIRIAGNSNFCNTIAQADAFLIGHSIDAISNPASASFTLGTGAIAVERVLVIGSSTFQPLGASSIRTLNIRGYNGGALNTLSATDNPPAADQVGLNIVLNNGAGFVNKDIFGAVTPPVGSLLLHVSP